MNRITNRIAGILALSVALLSVTIGPVFAEEGAATNPTEGTTTQAAPASPEAPAASSPAPAPSSPAPADPTATTAIPSPQIQPTEAAAPNANDPLASVRAGGAKLDAKANTKFEAALQPVVVDLEKVVAADGDRRVAERLGTEFGVTPDALLAEKSELKAGWGQLMIAYALAANSTSGVSARQLLDLRNEGMTWGQISTGMGYRLGEVLSAAKAEAKVAKGLAKPDGRMAEIHGTASKAGTSARPEKPAKSANAAASKAAPPSADSAPEVKAPAAESAKAAGGTTPTESAKGAAGETK